MTHQWPWPDDRLERRSRVAHMYRDRLADASPADCAELDDLMRTFGQSWIVDGFSVDPDDMLTVVDLAQIADIAPKSVRNWIARWPLQRKGTDDYGRALYRWGDVLEHLMQRNRSS